MGEERRAILCLVATGRVSPAEAERLLAVTADGREERWIIAAGVAASVAQIHIHAVLPVLARLDDLLPPGALPALHSGLFILTQWLGGRS
jgi:hypothetical protein